MTSCAKNLTSWTVYDAKEKKIYKMTNEKFKNLLLDRPHKLVSREIAYEGKLTWVDCILNSGDFK